MIYKHCFFFLPHKKKIFKMGVKKSKESLNKPYQNDIINKMINKLHKILNRKDLTVRTNNLTNKILETLKIVLGNCTDCENKINVNFKDFTVLTNKIESLLYRIEKQKQEQKKKDIIFELDDELFGTDN